MSEVENGRRWHYGEEAQARMSTNRTSIPDSTLNTSHRHINDESTKQQHQHQQPHQNHQYQTNANSKHTNQMDRSDEECDIIGQLIGKYGRYQFLMTFLLSLFQIPNTFHISSPIYQVCLSFHLCVCSSHTFGCRFCV